MEATSSQVLVWTSADDAWTPVGTMIFQATGRPAVLALASFDRALCAGGIFDSVDGVPANGIACRNASVWAPLGTGVGDGGAVRTLAVFGPNLVAGGEFAEMGGVSALHIASWRDGRWSALGANGLPGPVRALAVYGGTLYAAGPFIGLTAVVRLVGGLWVSLPQDIAFGTVGALAAGIAGLYAGGTFEGAGDTAASNIAAWNGSEWLALPDTPLSGLAKASPPAAGSGPGVNGTVNALLTSLCVQPGRTGPACADCMPGLYGPLCTPCSLCTPNGVCFDGVTGNCTCQPGFSGPTCSECAANSFGPDCIPCALCDGQGTCIPGRDGTCQCNRGSWSGLTCAMEEDNSGVVTPSMCRFYEGGRAGRGRALV